MVNSPIEEMITTRVHLVEKLEWQQGILRHGDMFSCQNAAKQVWLLRKELNEIDAKIAIYKLKRDAKVANFAVWSGFVALLVAIGYLIFTART